MLNVNLAIARGLSKSQVRDLVALHQAMDIMVMHLNIRCSEDKIPKIARKSLCTTVRRMEYQMQDKWGFPRNKEKHYHWKRFDCLVAHPPKWYEKMSPPVGTTSAKPKGPIKWND